MTANLDAQERVFGMVVGRVAGYRGLSPYTTALVEGIDDALDKRCARLVVQLVDDPQRELGVFSRWADGGVVSGVVLSDMVRDDPRPAACEALGLDMVIQGNVLGPVMHATVVDVDNDAAAALAVTHLLGLGHSRLARVSGPLAYEHTGARSHAIARLVRAAGASCVTVEGDYSERSGAELTAQLINERSVTAIIYDNDVMALGGLSAVKAKGLDVPRDISLLAWDDSPECQLADPPLTVVAADLQTLGESIAQALLDGPQRVVTTGPASLRPRGSTSQAPRGRSI